MTETLSKQTSSAAVALEENLLDWNEVLKILKQLLEMMFMKVG